MPVLRFDDDQVIVHGWTPDGPLAEQRARMNSPARYGPGAPGTLHRDRWPDLMVVHVFDADGVLVARHP